MLYENKFIVIVIGIDMRIAERPMSETSAW